MSSLINSKNNTVKTIIYVAIALMCLPVVTIIGKSIFALGQLLGSYTRLIGL